MTQTLKESVDKVFYVGLKHHGNQDLILIEKHLKKF